MVKKPRFNRSLLNENKCVRMVKNQKREQEKGKKTAQLKTKNSVGYKCRWYDKTYRIMVADTQLHKYN